MTQDKINKAVELIDEITKPFNELLKDDVSFFVSAIELDYYQDGNEIKDILLNSQDCISKLKSLLQSDNDGVEVSVYDEFKGVKYGTCNGRIKVKCGSDQKEGTEVCEICGTKLIWPDNQKKGEA